MGNVRRAIVALALLFALAVLVPGAASADTVAEESNFEVAIDSVEVNYDDPITLDSDTTLPSARVEYTVENTGTAADTQQITLSVEGVQVASQTVSLQPGERHTGTFSSDDGGIIEPFSTDTTLPSEVTIAVSSEDDRATETVALDPGTATFAVEGVSVNDPVEGEDVVVEAVVTNAGDASGTQTVTADAGQLGSDSTDVSLQVGQSTTVSFTFPTESGDAGTYDVAVSTGDDSAGAAFTVREGDGSQNESNFNVSIDGIEIDTSDIILHSDTDSNYIRPPSFEAVVHYSVQNTGTAADTQEIVLSATADLLAQEVQLGSQTVSLEPGESARGNFTFSEDDAGVVEPLDDSCLLCEPIEATVILSSEDDTDRETVVIGPGGDEPPAFEIEGVSASDAVEGEDVVVETTVTNTGDIVDSQAVEVDAGQLGTASKLLKLAGGESASLTFTFPTEAGDAGTYDVSVTTADDAAGTAFTVRPDQQSEANFDVSIDDARVELPDPGEPVPFAGQFHFSVAADYTVENTGNASDTQEIAFAIEGRQVDGETVSLDPGQSHSGTFSYGVGLYGENETGLLAGATDGEFEEIISELPIEPEPPYLPELTVSVASEDDRATETIRLDPGDDPPSFEIGDVSATDAVAGEDVVVKATITNTGDVTDTQTVEVDAGQLGSESRLQLLAGGESATVSFAFPTEAGDAGTYDVSVATNDDRGGAAFEVTPANDGEANFDVSIDDARVDAPNSSEPIVWPAENFGFGVEVDYTVANTGNASDTQEIAFAVEGQPRDSEKVSLDAGASSSGTFTAQVPVFEPLASTEVIPEPPYTPEITVSVASEDDRATETVSLDPGDGPSFEIDSVEANSPVEGEQLVVAVQITNTGDVADSQALKVDAGALGSESTLQLLGPGETVVQQFAFPTSIGDAGTYDVAVSTGDDRASTTTTVQEANDSEARFEVSIDDARINVSDPGPVPLPSLDAAVDMRLTIETEYTVENTGGANDTQAIVFALDGDTVDNETVSLAPGESHSGTFTAQVNRSDVAAPEPPCPVPHAGTCLPAVTVSVASDDDRAQERVILGPGGGPLPILGENAPLDLDGDGLHSDVRGDGETNIFDVQTLFANMNNPGIEQNAAAFDFQGQSPDDVTIFDVQALFADLGDASA